MIIRKAIEEDKNLFAEWEKIDRIEEKTCRPIEMGKKIQVDFSVQVLTVIKEDGDILGKFMYFDYNPRNLSCEFGYVMNPAYRGLGMGADMVGACIDYLFRNSELNLNKVYCQTAEFNEPSVRTLERLGMKRDAVLREHHELDGKFWNDFVYSLLRSEWSGCEL